MTGKVITVAQQKGGAGKTTIAAHLAVSLAQKDLNVVALDIDPQGSLSAWYEARKASMSDNLTHLSFRTLSDYWRLSAEIKKLAAVFDVVIVDGPPHAENDAIVAVKHADLVMVPIQPSPTDLWATAKTIELTNRENINTYLVLNRIVKNTKLSQQFMEELPRSRIRSTLGNRTAFPSSMAQGMTVSETAPKSVAAKEIEELTNEVIDIIAATEFAGAMADTQESAAS